MSKAKIGFTALPAPSAHEMPLAEQPDVQAIRALLSGKATEDQQIRFVAWFNKATAVDSNPYRPGGEDARRETDLACGRKLVGDWFYALAKATLQQPTQR
jgi:hypothetical protein